MTKADDKLRANFHQMTRMLDQLETDLEGAVARSERIPEAWHAIAKSGGRGAKVKMTLWVEADVLAFFRAMGTGHTPRMADVLKTFMHARHFVQFYPCNVLTPYPSPLAFIAATAAMLAAAVVKYGILSIRATRRMSRLSLIACAPSVVFITRAISSFFRRSAMFGRPS